MKKYKRFVAFLLSALLVFSTISVNTMDVTAAVDMSSDEFSDDSLGLNSQEESWEDSESGFSDSYEEGASDELSCPDTSDNDNSAEIVSEKENIDTAADTEVREGSSDASEFEAEGSEEEFISDPVDTETQEESVDTAESGLGEAPAETTAEAGTQEVPSNITQEENPNVTEDAAMEEASDTMQDGDPHTAESEADMPDEDMETPGVEDTGNSLAVEGDYLWPGEAEEYYDPESVSADRTAGAEQDIAELPLYTDYDTAVQAVRDQAAARKDRAYLKVSEDLLDQVQDGKLWDDVFAHTGNPKEGDYLLYSGAFFYQESAEIQEDGSWIVVLKFYSYYDSAEQEAAVDQEVERIVTLLGLRDGAKSKYDKVSAIYDYITSTVAYDFDTKDKGLDEHPEKYSAYGAIVEHNAVCQGYALMFYRLALEAGVDSRIISSNEGQLDDGGHAWNIACLDGLCYLIDTTWDAGKGRDDWVYFMRGKNDFGNHENPDDQFHDSVFAEIYPLSEFKYGFTIEPIATAPEISLLTWDDKVITTCAENGRAKLLLFYQKDCYWCKELFRQIREAGLQGVDIVLIDIWWQTGYEKYRDQQIKKLGTDSFPLDIPGLYYVFCSNTYNTYGIFEEVCGLSGGKPTPGVFMINANNEIIYGDYGANEGIVEMMSQYLSNPSAPAPGVLDLYQDGFEKIGRCGDDVIWRFYSDGTLRLSGKGYTWDNFWSPTGIGWMGENDDEWGDNYSPTYIYCNDVKKIIVDEEVGILGGNLFNGFGNVESITFLNHGPDLDAPSCDGGYKSVKKMYSSYCVMPYISDENRKVNVYYPESDPTWTPEVLKALGRYNSCRWIPVDENGVHHHEWGDWVITQAQLLKEGGTKRRDCTICGKM